jgi:DNA-binding NtrC family response regulator
MVRETDCVTGRRRQLATCACDMRRRRYGCEAIVPTSPQQARKHILVVDDEAAVVEMLTDLLTDAGYVVDGASSGTEALAKLTDDPRISLLLLDLYMPGMNGLELLERLRADGSDIPVILITAHSSSSLAIRAMQLGADDYIPKPFDLDAVLLSARRLFEQRALSERVRSLEERPEQRERLIGRSPAMSEIYKTIGLVAASDATVLITGETGTGKELVANSIHLNSARRAGPFVKINCGALPDSLVEIELFGHERGAFAGAVTARKGYFEQAHRGTILLDEVGELPLPIQEKLLRVLQEGEIQRVGGSVIPRHPNVYSFYEAGLEELLNRLGREEDQATALVYQQRLFENIAHSKRHGDTESLRSGRAEIIEQLNELAKSALGISFNSLILPGARDDALESAHMMKVDVRVLATTNRDLRDDVVQGRFRPDLYYRLNIVTIYLPPLRERRGDIAALVEHILGKYRTTAGEQPARIAEDALELLERHDWPGNVRELENEIERAVVLSRGNVITSRHLTLAQQRLATRIDLATRIRQREPLATILAEVEQVAIAEALRQSDGDEAAAAGRLGMPLEEFRERRQRLA